MNWQETVDKVARTPLSQILIFALVLTVYRLVVFKFLKNTPVHRRTGAYSFLSGVSELFDALIYAAIFIFMVIRPYFFQTFQIPTGSMVPSLMVGDFIGLNKAIYRYTEPKRGDVVVFRPPARACTPEQLAADGTVKVDFVKRLIGLPGETVEIKMGNIFIDGKPLYEPYKHYTIPDSKYVNFKLMSAAESANMVKTNWKLVEYKGQL
ncbi:MAG TPA: signal peptidase I, partial [Fimbriimonas sp.]|nr:signal peptidase I [Fimbriimonas sp.]